MADLIAAIANYAGWLYLLLGLLAAREVALVFRAGRERDRSLFGVEREAAVGRAVRALVTLFLLVTIAAGVYTVAAVIAPTLPPSPVQRANHGPMVATPLRNPPPTESPTPEPARTPTRRPVRIVTATPEG